MIALNLNLIKMRGKTRYTDVPVLDITDESVIDTLRKMISGVICIRDASSRSVSKTGKSKILNNSLLVSIINLLWEEQPPITRSLAEH